MADLTLWEAIKKFTSVTRGLSEADLDHIERQRALAAEIAARAEDVARTVAG